MIRGLARDLEPHATGAQYVNFLGQDTHGGSGAADGTLVLDDAWHRAAAVYGEETLARLAEVKQRYDPGNVFRLNHNIPTLLRPA